MLITIGRKAQDIVIQVMEGGTKAEVHSFKDVTGVLDVLKPNLNCDTFVLVKSPLFS
ncbi:hypothetical protein ACIQ2D_08125 [Lysinibacillus sp. NPDC097287]|uniref:hypothetical protein n=1 Tax=Lysinibacillus sp. NPDC097287 TaxID=3364144 RepID=UPI003808041F